MMPEPRHFGIRFPNVGPRRFGSTPGFFSQYYNEILSTNPIAYWPMWDDVGSSIAIDLKGLMDGVPSNVTFGVNGTGDGRTAAYLDSAVPGSGVSTGAGAVINANFPTAAGTLFGWFKVSGSGVWTDGALRSFWTYEVDTNNRVFARKETTNNRISFFYVAGGTSKSILVDSVSVTDWFSCAMTWSKAADEFKGYLNGIQQGTTQTGLGTWAGNTFNFRSLAGGYGNWSGSFAHCIMYNMVLTPAEILNVHRLNP